VSGSGSRERSPVRHLGRVAVGRDFEENDFIARSASRSRSRCSTRARTDPRGQALVSKARVRPRPWRSASPWTVSRRYGEYENRRARRDEMRDRLLPLAERSLEATREAYRNARLEFLDLLDAQRTLLEARAAALALERDLNAPTRRSAPSQERSHDPSSRSHTGPRVRRCRLRQSRRPAPAAPGAAAMCKHRIADAECPFLPQGTRRQARRVQGARRARAMCWQCKPSLVTAYKMEGDWCGEHGLPESKCTLCNH